VQCGLRQASGRSPFSINIFSYLNNDIIMKLNLFKTAALLSILAAASVLTANAATNAQPAARYAVKVGHLLVPGQAKIFIAKDLGYFAEQGIDVELVEFSNSADGLSALRAGKLDFGVFGATAPLFHIDKGADIRIVGGIHNEDAALIATPEKTALIKTVADLKGKKIAVVRLSSGDAALRGKLVELGLDPKKDVQIFELKSPPAVIEAVRSGEVDAGTVWEPHIVRAEESGLKVVARSHDLVPGHPCCRLAIQTKDVSERPQLIEGFLTALLKAEKYGHDHRDKSVDIITDHLKLDRHIIDKSYLNDQPTDPDVANTKRFWNVMRKVGFAETDKNIADFIDTSFYKRALDKLAVAEPNEPFWKEQEKAFAANDTVKSASATGAGNAK
jgi:NitT/TauT family transport system substrate-binding protein